MLLLLLTSDIEGPEDDMSNLLLLVNWIRIGHNSHNKILWYGDYIGSEEQKNHQVLNEVSDAEIDNDRQCNVENQLSKKRSHMSENRASE